MTGLYQYWIWQMLVSYSGWLSKFLNCGRSNLLNSAPTLLLFSSKWNLYANCSLGTRSLCHFVNYLGARIGDKCSIVTHRSTLVFYLMPPIHPCDFGVKLIQRVHCQQNLLTFHFRNTVKLTSGHKSGFLHSWHEFPNCNIRNLLNIKHITT
jgi:hypothetical protein